MAYLRALVIGIAGAAAFSTQPGPKPEPEPEPTYAKKITLPTDARPEGVVGGKGNYLFAGSLTDGRIWKIDTATSTVVEHVSALPATDTIAAADRMAVGLCYDELTDIVWVAGGPSLEARAFDAETGAMLGAWPLTSKGGFINDCIVTSTGVWFTNTYVAELYQLPFSGADHMLPNTVTTIALTGDWVQVEGFNANGIEALPDGSLYVVHSVAAKVYHVTLSGVAHEVMLTTAAGEAYPVTNGDGMLLDGMQLYVVLNPSKVAVFDMDSSNPMMGVESKTVADSDFDEVTTIAKVEDRFYGVNARFAATPPTQYDVVLITDLP